MTAGKCPNRERGSSAFRLAAVIVAVGVALATGLLVGSRAGGESVTPSSDSVDAGFARDMRQHHAQAVEMSVLVLQRSSDPVVRQVALDIETTQQQQIGQMYAWLDLWELPKTTPEPPMGWMGEMDHMSEMDHMDQMAGAVPMPGMASDREIEALRAAEGREADRIFLQLMIPHHVAGVHMAEYAAEEASVPQVRHLAGTMASSQTSEIAALREMLAERGGPIALGG